MRLIVTEKPSVARDLGRVLGATRRSEHHLEGDGVRITWCIGHLCELEDPAHYGERYKKWALDTLPIVPGRFDLRLRPGDGLVEHWNAMKKLLRDRAVEQVVNACDAGREGELIFRWVVELAECKKPIVRFWTSSLTDDAIKDAWARLRPATDFDTLGDAARCRAEADWLVGLNATRALTCLARNAGGDQLLSVGRVQTPTLAMIVERDRAIAAFVPETYYTVKARFEVARPDATLAWDATWFADVRDEAPSPEGDRGGDDEAPRSERLTDESVARAIAAATQGRTGRVAEAQRKRTREQPPLLYDLTSLQRRANDRYGLPAPRTLEVAQALYEQHKLITYPRTDARHVTPAEVALLPKMLEGLRALPVYAPFVDRILAAGAPKPGKRVVDAAEVGDHHAILPTGKPPNRDALSADEKRVFDLVARRLLAVLMPDALFDVTTLIVNVAETAPPPLPEGIAAPLRYRARGRVCREQGWRAVDPPGRSREIDLPPVEVDDVATAASTDVQKGQTRPPKPHTDASLLRAMETAGRALDDAELRRAMRQSGLGTPATRAAILQTLLDRQYVERREKELHATDRGRALIDAVPLQELKSAELTGRWEARLAAVAEGREHRPRFMQDVVAHVREVVSAIAAAPPPTPEVRAPDDTVPVLGECPLCGTPVREGRVVYDCEKGRGCPFVVWKTIAKRPISARMVRQLLKEGRTPVFKGFESKAGKEFEAGLEIVEGKVSLYFPARPRASAPAPPPRPRVGDTCPKCGAGHLVQGRTAIGCDRWREGCDFRAPA